MPPGPLPLLPGETAPVKEEVKTTYESAPILRDLRKEAAAFVPTAVKRKLEADKMRLKSEEEVQAEEDEAARRNMVAAPRVNAAPEVDVDAEVRRFAVEMEEVGDDDQ